ncbi:alpha-L-rhamnosidase [Paenibacillus selenitireducens]|uniref:alpha-L-rhamnosidase n=1 Tax=Paenibacillus selenitireducens TaxID=1324314 RepID=A0A1T2XAG4_9BACL|nr:alpha-L-rhamnosidase [Paenibacillus selenitireducens]OPA76887.1 alpha-L-rhamnosidase [Paenibacillus selenitireducens]
MHVYDLRCEYKHNPIGTDIPRPRLSWKIHAGTARDESQTAYQVQVSAYKDFQTLWWDTDRVMSARSVHVEYEGPALSSRTRYYYRVRVWTEQKEVTEWSEAAYWETAFLYPKDYKAQWITASLGKEGQIEEPCAYVRKSIHLGTEIASARVYATARGLYRLYINGSPADAAVFAPGWTSYHHRLQYQTYDVTSLLASGENVLGVILGDGWYKGNLAFGGARNLYGQERGLWLQMHVTYQDGSEEIVVSDGTWTYNGGPLIRSEIYHGETYDARLEQTGWNQQGFDSQNWNAVTLAAQQEVDSLVAQENDPTRIIEYIQPVAVLHTPAGEAVLDMGQNMVGWVRFRVQAEAGTVIRLQHAEVLDREGNFYIGNLRAAKQMITYTCKGEGEEVYEPCFSFQGFRYVKVEGISLRDDEDRFLGCVIHTDMEKTGSFHCSNPLLNQLQHNIVWGQKGNFLDVPTDCPQRDERLGWTGDAQVFIRTAAFNYQVAPFFSKWLKDLAVDQAEDGGVPHVVPGIHSVGYNSSAWGDAAVICPWAIYENYGDVRVLEQQYPSMKAWVEYIRAQGEHEYLWDTGDHFGDWLALDAEEDSYTGATPKAYIATAFYAHSTHLLAKTARIIGEHEDAEAYEALHGKIVEAFQAEFITPEGDVAAPTQTAYLLALMFNLVKESHREAVARDLAAHIEAQGTHLTTGFVGTPYLCHVLTRYGYTDLAYRLVLQEEYPSWLYSVKKGATTIWEHWDGIKPDGTFWSEDMNSFNHYAYGAIGEWLYRVVGGIDTMETEPGYRRIRIQPHIGGGLSSAETRLQSMYGEIVSSWEKQDQEIKLMVTIPANTTASVILTLQHPDDVRVDGHLLCEGNGIRRIMRSQDSVEIELGSGTYHFAYS